MGRPPARIFRLSLRHLYPTVSVGIEPCKGIFLSPSTFFLRQGSRKFHHADAGLFPTPSTNFGCVSARLVAYRSGLVTGFQGYNEIGVEKGKEGGDE